MFVASGLGVAAIRRYEEERAWVIHTLATRKAVLQARVALEQSVIDAAQGIVSDEIVPEDLTLPGLSRLSEELKRLARSVEDDENQSARLRHVRAALVEWQASLRAGPDVAGPTMSRKERFAWNLESTNRPRQLLEVMFAEEDRLLNARLHDQRAYGNRALSLLAVAIVIGIGGSLAMGYAFASRVMGRIRQMGAYAIARGRGMPAPLDTSGNDELSILAQRIRQGSDEIEWREREHVRSQQRFRAIVDHMTSALFISDDDGRIAFVNKEFAQAWKSEPERMIGRPATEVFPPKTAEAFLERSRAVRQTGVPVITEQIVELPDGPRWFLSSRFLIPSEDPSRPDVCGIATDVTERRRAVEAVQELNSSLEARVEERTRNLEEANFNLEIEKERTREQLVRMRLLNEIAKAISGRLDISSLFSTVLASLHESFKIDFGLALYFEEASDLMIVGARVDGNKEIAPHLFHGAVLELGSNGLRRCIQGDLVHVPDLRLAHDGVFRDLALSGMGAAVAVPLRGSDGAVGAHIVARRARESFSSGECEFLSQLAEHVAIAVSQLRLFDDLQRANLELREAQDHLSQQERLRAMGQMASGIAHDINNALGPVMMYTEMLMMDESIDPKSRAYAGNVLTAADGIAKTVSMLRHFYRPAGDDVVLMDAQLNALVHQVVGLTRPRWRDQPLQEGKVVNLILDLARSLPPIPCSETEIRNALTNLIFNAVDAMPDGGNLTIQTELQAEHVILSVWDTGLGMDEYARQRCLEPFFTTKGKQGTGLGLAMVLGIVKRHGGHITVESEPRKGTCFHLYFPLTAPSQKAEPQPDPLLPPLRQLRLLCVDDDPTIREGLSSLLATDGHTVRTAENGSNALAILDEMQRAGNKVDVVITDLGMPGIDGRTLGARIHEKWPELPIVMLTGWGSHLMDQAERMADFACVLSKPPRLREVRRALQKALGKLPE